MGETAGLGEVCAVADDDDDDELLRCPCSWTEKTKKKYT
jgi:hypothetical protein